MQPETIEYISELATESFKRQLDLDEAVWRSLPFFAAVFAFVAALIGRAATDAPPLRWAPYPVATNALIVCSVLALGWSLRWFWALLKSREYEYPAADEDILNYAKEVTYYHASGGLDGEALDRVVLDELRLFMARQHGSAARTNFLHNAERMAGRSRLLLFILVAFVLAFLSEATIFLSRTFNYPADTSGELSDDTKGSHGASELQLRGASTQTEGTKATLGIGGGQVLGGQFKAVGEREGMTKPTNQTVKPGMPSNVPRRLSPRSWRKIARLSLAIAPRRIELAIRATTADQRLGSGRLKYVSSSLIVRSRIKRAVLIPGE